jgi:hypothetical protein
MSNNNPIPHLKDREKYRQAKISKGKYKGYEQTKLLNNLKKEIKQEEAWKMITGILLLAFSVITIVILISNIHYLSALLVR